MTFPKPTKESTTTSFPSNEETKMLQFLNEQGYQLQNDQFRSTKLPAWWQKTGSNNNSNSSSSNNNKTPNSISLSFSPKRRPKHMFKGNFAGVSSAALEEMKDDDDDDNDNNNFNPSSSSRTRYPSGSFLTIHERGEKKRWKAFWFLLP